MIKVCHLTLRNAHETRIFNKECEALKLNYEVTILSSDKNIETTNGIQFAKFDYKRRQWFRNLIRTLHAAYRQKAVVYHIHDAGLLLPALLLQWQGKQIIIDVNEHYFQQLQNPDTKNYRWKFLRFLERKIAKRGAFILSQRDYILTYQKRVKTLCVVENFCDTNFMKQFQNTDRSASKGLVYCGPVTQSHGALQMLKVLHVLHHRGHEVTLDLIGEFPSAELQKEMEEEEFYFGIKKHVRMHGKLSTAEAYTIAKESFAAIYLEKETKSNSEIYPYQLFEYMSVGLPVVASNISLYRAVIERRECGICVPFDDITEIANAVEKIYLDKALQKTYATNGTLAVSQNYNWNFERNILLDFYKTVVGGIVNGKLLKVKCKM